MRDLAETFADLDLLEVPEMRSDVDTRIADGGFPAAEVPVRPVPTPRWKGPLIAFGTAVAILVVTVATVLLLQGGDSFVEPAETVPTPTVITTVPTTQPPTELLGGARFTLVPAAGVDPIRISTVLGDMEFVTMQLPPNEEFDFYSDLAATPHGPIAVTTEGTLWWSADYQTWQTTPIDVDADRITVVGDDVVVSGMRTMSRLVWDGDRWSTVERAEFLDRNTPGTIDYLAFGTRGVVAANLSTIYYSTDGTTFTEAERGPDATIFVASDQNPEDAEFEEAARMDCRGTYGAERSLISGVVATDAGFVAFTSASHPADAVCAPLLWFSPDGNTWELVSPESPFGELTEINIYSIAERGGRFVATGGVEAELRGHVWVSDDAVTWQQADVAIARPFFVDAGESGWVVVGAATLNDFGLWFSADGYTWDGPHPLPEGLIAGYMLPEFVVGSNTILAVGIDAEIFVIGRPPEGEATP